MPPRSHPRRSTPASQLRQAQRVLGGYLAFAAFPRMEVAGHDLIQRLLMMTEHVQQRYVFQRQIVTLGSQQRPVV